jgi:SpoVK/Ycf46/Vps4 family AAA+-type ATPase
MTSKPMESSWVWQRRYRVWEANRKVFLFPENWIEPEERPSRRPIDLREIIKTASERRASVLLSSATPAVTLLTGRAAAAGLAKDLYRVDLRDIVSKYIGETEKNLDRVFDAVASTDVVLLFDEADALFGKRSETKDAHDRFANAEVDYLLARIEAFEGLFILATNSTRATVEPIVRRFTFVMDVVPTK